MLTEEITPDDVLTGLETNIVRANGGKRFLNYIIDLVLFYALAIGLGVLIVLLSPSSMEWIDNEPSGFNFADRIITLVLYAIYMFAVEAIFKGKSLGKLITGTRAVNLDGSAISISTALSRGFSRAVPFCVFSALGNPCIPWQDKWTDTMVIDEKQSGLKG